MSFGPVAAATANKGVVSVYVANSITEGTVKRRLHKRHTQSTPQHAPEKLWRDLGVSVLCGWLDEARASAFHLLEAEVGPGAGVRVGGEGGAGGGVYGF